MEESYKGTFWKSNGNAKGYVSHYSSVLLFPVILVAGLNILDSLFTMMILDFGGSEVNPVVRSVIALYGDGFWVWKFAIVSASLVVLCVHSGFKLVKVAILGVSVIYISTILYEIFLLS